MNEGSIGVSIDTTPLEETRNKSGYALIGQMTTWVESVIKEYLHGDELNGQKAPILVAEQVSKCLPICEGYGNATIARQLDYWTEHKEDFYKFLKRREAAAKLVELRNATINTKFTAEQELNMKNIVLDYLTPEQIEKYPEEISKYREERVSLLQEIGEHDAELDGTEAEFTADKNMRNGITSNIDCKLPAIITGQILRKLGWEIGLVCTDYPEHPWILASKTDGDQHSVYMISFNGNSSGFKSLPKIETNITPRHISSSRYFATKAGFITDQDVWPLPFNEDSFKRFDSWYVDHVENGKQRI